MRFLFPILMGFAGAAAYAQPPAATMTPAPPKIVETSPKAWQVGANTTQKELSVTFDQRMSPGFTAWMGRSSITPPQFDVDSKISEDRRTFSIRADFQPGKVYVFGLNEKNLPGVGFQNERGQSAPPYFLVFQTAGNPAPDDAPPRVAGTNPPNNAQVDPAKVKSLAITFDKPMQPAKHGLQILENGKEVDLSKAKFAYSGEGKVFTIGYDFKPSSSYELVLNSTQNIGFASAKRVPLWPVRFGFSTR